jgi:hypothetical protein
LLGNFINNTISLGLGGLRALRQNPPIRRKFSIAFDIKSDVGGVRVRVAKRLRTLFSREIFRSYGGYIERLRASVDGVPIYRVFLVTSSTTPEILDDTALLPLWQVLIGEYGVHPDEIDCSPLDELTRENRLDPNLECKFLIHRIAHADEPEPDGWSEVLGDYSDNESIFSIQTVQLA